MTAMKTPDWMVGRLKPVALRPEDDPDRLLTPEEKLLVARDMFDEIPAKALGAYTEDGNFPQPQTYLQLLCFDEWIDEQKIRHPENPNDIARLLGL